MKIFDINNLTKALEVMHKYVEPQYTRVRKELKAYRTYKSDLGYLENRVTDCFSDEFKAALAKEHERVTKQEEILAIEYADLQKAYTAILDAKANKKTVHHNDINVAFKQLQIPIRVVRINTPAKELVLEDVTIHKETSIKYGYATFDLQLYRYLKDKITDVQLKKEIVEQLFQYMYERIDKSDIFGEVAK